MTGEEPTWLEIELTHPDCWTLKITEDTEIELLSQHVNQTKDDTVRGYFIASGTSSSEVDNAVAEVEGSDLTNDTYSLGSAAGEEFATGKGKHNQGLVVEYNSDNSITDSLIGQGFLVQRPVRITDGVENWTMIAPGERREIREKIECIQERMDATVAVKRISTGSGLIGQMTPTGPELTARQREVFEHARSRGYYAWPRKVTAEELATDLDITKTTLLEHLHKVESKLLHPTED